MKREVIVVTAAYGHQQVQALGGQHALLPIIAAAGADGVEIRRELLDETELTQLTQLGQAIARHQLTAFYSVPEALFMADGTLNPHLERRFQEAEQLRAQLLKFSLGHYQRGFDSHALRQLQANHQVHLVVENDQTDCGKLSALESFFHDCGETRLPNGMTFDMGNWRWVGDDALAAADMLARYVSYIHIKVAVPHDDSWRAVAPDEADSCWRELLQKLPTDVPRGIEFPLQGDDLIAITRHYVNLLREE
ncbi:Putative sugar phosphate isomerase/epimerase protein [Paramixta manurensis]|uniref:Sugar phosphate isomerase/epimerase protein n=1 Tax=Paramixta manurensis TaxID=2740817 RepID=A0A6M8UBL4_9GAMM|nr:Putative sugar phosphate isomerase/epimerase protein [Erwiniaceae bacterium PD-1]